MNEKELRTQRINSFLKLSKLPSQFQKLNSSSLGAIVSNFVHHVFIEKTKSLSLNWCFANIKRAKIFFQIFHANQMGKEMYKEEIAKNLTEYSYKTIAKIIDEGVSNGYYILLAADIINGRDTKVKNIRPSEELITDFLNLSIEILAYIDKNKILPK